MGTYGASNISFSCTKDLEFMLFIYLFFFTAKASEEGK